MNRKSVRSYDGKGLTAEERSKIEEYAKNIRTPFGIDAEYRILDGQEYGLTSPVLTGVDTYIAGKTEIKPG